MKIAVTAQGGDLKSPVDPRFGRSSYLVIFDDETQFFEALENPGQSVHGGAGITAAQELINRGVKVLLTGNVGPNAYYVLQEAGIEVYGVSAPTVEEAIEEWRQGKAQPLNSPSTGSHHGMGGRGCMGPGPGRGRG